MATGRAVVYFARAAHVFSAQIKCRHCRLASGMSKAFGHSTGILTCGAMIYSLR